MSSFLYLDYNATTPIDPAVREVMLPFLGTEFGNPSSLHRLGRCAAHALMRAREQVATLIGSQPSEIIFTSGGTESITSAILSAIASNPKKRHIITSVVEHDASLAIFRDLEQRGYTITYLPVDEHGNISLEELENSITSATLLVSLLWANNETGVIFPIEKIATITNRKNISLHVDAIQAVGKIAIDLSKGKIQYLSLSGHKIYAPKGIGALYVHRHLPYAPLLRGHQEESRRGGTENVASIVALGEACQLASQQLAKELSRQEKLRDRFEKSLLTDLPGVHRNGNLESRLSNTSNLTFRDIEAESALMLLDQEGLCCSIGSACSSGSKNPSHVLTAMGLSRPDARASLRFSLGRLTTETDIDHALEIIKRVMIKLRSL